MARTLAASLAGSSNAGSRPGPWSAPKSVSALRPSAASRKIRLGSVRGLRDEVGAVGNELGVDAKHRAQRAFDLRGAIVAGLQPVDRRLNERAKRWDILFGGQAEREFGAGSHLGSCAGNLSRARKQAQIKRAGAAHGSDSSESTRAGGSHCSCSRGIRRVVGESPPSRKSRDLNHVGEGWPTTRQLRPARTISPLLPQRAVIPTERSDEGSAVAFRNLKVVILANRRHPPSMILCDRQTESTPSWRKRAKYPGTHKNGLCLERHEDVSRLPKG